jgi:hypothetical protein
MILALYMAAAAFRPIGSIRTDCVIGSAIGWARDQAGSKLGNHDVVH